MGERWRCRGCGEYVEPDHGAEGARGHTVMGHHPFCDGAEACWRLCPVMEACGPVEVEHAAAQHTQEEA